MIEVLSVILAIPVFFCFLILLLVLFGSSVDPDDNGLLRSKEAKAKYRAKKLKKLEELEGLYNKGDE